MPVEFASVAYTLTDCRIAPLLSNGQYPTTSIQLGYGQEVSFEPAHDNDALKAYGLTVELLSILQHVEGTIKQGAFDPDAFFVMTGHGAQSTGTTPSQIASLDILAGGAGLPYFGIVGAWAGLNGSNILIGLRKCKLDTIPGWTVEQNKFRVSDTKFKAVAIDPTTRKALRINRYETATAIPANLNTFFS